MAATLKVGDETKRELDRLQASLTMELPTKPSLQELLEELVRLGQLHRDELARALGSTWRPATREEIDALFTYIHQLNQLPPTGPPMSAEDREIYEEDWKR